MRTRRLDVLVGAFILALGMVLAGLALADYRPVSRAYSDADFSITPEVASVDADGDGVPDYEDLWLGALAEAERRPTYDSSYVASGRGLPDPETGACTDVVWRAFRDAGYDLPAMVNRDIAARTDAYPRVDQADPRIDYRRVVNLHVFFSTYARSLPTDTDSAAGFDPSVWQVGDIVTLGPGSGRLTHIAILGPDRDRTGLSWISHNGGQTRRYEPALRSWQVMGHFRFDAAAVPSQVLVRWGEDPAITG
ncbi:MAG: DUF1287 domain-containing protein [Bowdeniella nasicola]|nr:DUF1287 domain-containing protein [Bowdeniella nasicola]